MLKVYYSKSDITKAYIQMHLSILLWGLTGVLGRGIDLSEGLLVWYRMMIVSVSLFLYIKWKGYSLRVSRAQLKLLVGVGVLLMVHWVFFYGAIKYSNISVTMSLFASTTLFTALMEPLVTGKRFNYAELFYSALAMCGIGLIFYTDTNNYKVGIILALLAAFVGAFFNILNKKIVTELPSSIVSFYEIFSGFGALTLLLPLYLHFFSPSKLLPTTWDWSLLIVLAIVCTHITLLLSLNALKHLSAFTLNLAINLEPVYAIVLAFVFYHENKELSGWFFAGAALIMTSVVFHALLAKEER